MSNMVKMVEPPVFKIRNDLLDAYKGVWENELILVDGPHVNSNTLSPEEFEQWIRLKILTDSPKERLLTYCNWNGIIGYVDTFFDIATGKLS